MPPPALVQRSDALDFSERLLCVPEQGAVGVFEGAAGIGKSALIDAACAMGAARGLTVLRAAGFEFERDLAYGVVRQLFDPLLPEVGRSWRRAPPPPPLGGPAGGPRGGAGGGGGGAPGGPPPPRTP